MDNLNSNYLMDKLKGGEKLNITLLSHNAYWFELQLLDKYFENCSVQVFGDGVSYINMAGIERTFKIENSDLIIWYSSRLYSEKELNELRSLAAKISDNKNKRVSIGYLYSVPAEYRIDKNMPEEILIISYYNGECLVEEKNPISRCSVYDLTNMTLVATKKEKMVWYPELREDIDINFSRQSDDICKSEYNWFQNPGKGRAGEDDGKCLIRKLKQQDNNQGD